MMTEPNGTTEPADSERASIRAMSAKQLAQLGMSQLAYVRLVMMDGERAYAIHGADGTPVAVAADLDLAEAAIEQQDLVQVPVH
jgi:hypothetical protein